ncbi:hypothetical protein CDAR_436401 [Caerostris darwini]|uniref:Uncharacterized protein n=1 Tax=Caerostris darwini TaxID=1538125 RepID=A0AAV4R7P8_9ARAC|nr:hypothetical protein CDAR_436401 [Caerostris darwini]
METREASSSSYHVKSKFAKGTVPHEIEAAFKRKFVRREKLALSQTNTIKRRPSIYPVRILKNTTIPAVAVFLLAHVFVLKGSLPWRRERHLHQAIMSNQSSRKGRFLHKIEVAFKRKFVTREKIALSQVRFKSRKTLGSPLFPADDRGKA